jgi:hypothetical protein
MDDLYTLSSYVLDKEACLQRNFPNDSRGWDSDGWKSYDRNTLIYDTFFDQRQALVRIFMPPPLNFEKDFFKTKFFLNDNIAEPINFSKYKRFCKFDLRFKEKVPPVLKFQSSIFGKFNVLVKSTNSSIFKDCKVIYTLQRNQPLDWIKDWMLFHNKIHGANAVLISNNNSDAYTDRQLLDAMKSVPGFKVCKVLTVPLPWGPFGKYKGIENGKYLQTALLNIVRDRFLQDSYAVLNADIDELVLSNTKKSVFDLAQKYGYVSYSGRWVFSNTAPAQPYHKNHVYVMSNSEICPPKYCYKPSSYLGKMALSVHRHSGFLGRFLSKIFARNRDLLYLHCRHISTSWKYDRSKVDAENIQFDLEVDNIMSKAFGSRNVE